MLTMGGIRKYVSAVFLVISAVIGSSEGQVMREFANWHVPEAFNTKPESFAVLAVYPVSEEDFSEFWAAGTEQRVSSIYYVQNGQWNKQQAVPDVGDICDISMFNSNLGWSIGETGTLEYDGVFWRKKVSHEKKSQRGGELISILSENEVWFGNGYRMRDRIYERKLSPYSLSSIYMKDSLNGIYLSERIHRTSDGEKWNSRSYYGSHGNGGLDDNLNVLFSYGSVLYTYVWDNSTTQLIHSQMTLKFVKLVENEIWFTASFSSSYSFKRYDVFPFLKRPYLYRYSIADSTCKINSAPDSLFSNKGEFRTSIKKLTIHPNYIVVTFWDSNLPPEVAFFVSPSLSTVTDLRLDNLSPANLPQVGSTLFHTITLANEGDGFLELGSIIIDGDMFFYQPDAYTLGDFRKRFYYVKIDRMMLQECELRLYSHEVLSCAWRPPRLQVGRCSVRHKSPICA